MTDDLIGPSGRLDRRAMCRAVLAERGDMLVIAGLGAPAWDITAIGDCAENFPLWGGMGGAAMIGLGLALAQPQRKVLVITGDGEMLMGLGSLATTGLQRPGNLSIVVLDNEVYGETGGQASHTAATTDLTGVARACGLTEARALTTLAEIEGFAAELADVTLGPRFVSIKIDAANRDRVLASRDGQFIVTRIRTSLGLAPI